jgi:peptidyl-prolyl cis-trans isomerase SurA
VTTTLPLVALLAVAAAPAEETVVDRVAAVVNGEVIMLSELTERAGSEWIRVEALPPGKERDKARGEALSAAFDQVLAERLLSAAALKDQVEANELQVNQAIEDVKQRNHMDDAQLDAALRAQGIDRATYRAQVKRELDSFLVLEHRVRSRVKVSDEDARNYFQAHAEEYEGETEVHARHIFLPLAEGASPAEEARVRAEADKLRARLEAGADFAAEAKRTSKGPSAGDGGDLGWLRRGTIQKVLEDAAFALEPGQVSAWVRAGPGLHLLTVVEKRLAGARTFEEAKEEVRNRLYQQQVESFRNQLIGELRREAVIETKLPELASR